MLFLFAHSFTEIEKLLDYREEEVMEIVDDVTPAASNAAAAAVAAVAAAASENRKRDEAAALTASLRSAGSSAHLHRASSSSALSSGSGGMPNSASYDALHATASVTNLDANGEEIQRSATQIFAPVERISRVFEKIWEDPYSISFQDPVDITVYDDYLDVSYCCTQVCVVVIVFLLWFAETARRLETVGLHRI